MNVLVLNCGSSSLKFKLFSGHHLKVVAKGIVEEIGRSKSAVKFYKPDGSLIQQDSTEIRNHLEAIKVVSSLLSFWEIVPDLSQLSGIGHRVVHGGEFFTGPVLVDKKVIEQIKTLIPLAPLHNPANLTGIQVALEHAPQVPQVAVFDTAFHQTIPESSYLYAIPTRLYEKHGVRRYGFHGTSYSYVTKRAAKYLKKNYKCFSCICLHLGNGASAAAVKNGKSMDTSMGLTPLEGLVMGTRSGDIDPAIIPFIARNLGLSIDEIDSLLNKQSGLLGLCGESDMRTIEQRVETGDDQALLAIDIFCHRARKYVGAYMALTGRPDCIIFTGGIGENSSFVRQKICQDLDWLGIHLDQSINHKTKGLSNPATISSKHSTIKVLVVPTNEELEIARQTLAVLEHIDLEGAY